MLQPLKMPATSSLDGPFGYGSALGYIYIRVTFVGIRRCFNGSMTSGQTCKPLLAWPFRERRPPFRLDALSHCEFRISNLRLTWAILLRLRLQQNNTMLHYTKCIGDSDWDQDKHSQSPGS